MARASVPQTTKPTIETGLVSNAISAMFAAIEIHNKPVFQYRYEVCTLLVVNAWELALKAYIAKELKSVRLTKQDGTTKPFPECVACVSRAGGPGCSGRFSADSYTPTDDTTAVIHRAVIAGGG